MDIIFFLTGCLCLAETIDLFMEKDFMLFLGGNLKPENYDLKKLYAVEKWIFAADTLGFYGLTFHVGGFAGDIALIIFIFATLAVHIMVFKSPNFQVKKENQAKRKNKKR